MLERALNLADVRLHRMPTSEDATYTPILLTDDRPSPYAGDLIACVYRGKPGSEERRHWEQLFIAAPQMYAALRDIILSARKAGIELIDMSRGREAVAIVEK